jgi:hypothetical protein
VRPDGEKTMDLMRRSLSRNGLLVSVYDDRTAFRRRDFRHDADLGPDWVLPHASAESRPFGFAQRAVKSKAPEFGATAKVSAVAGMTLTRAAKKSLGPKASKSQLSDAQTAAVNVSFPAVERTFKTIAWRYDVKAELENGSIVFEKRVLATDYHLPAASAAKSYSLAFLRSQLPESGKVRFTVTPYDCFGNAGRSIKSDYLELKA